MFYTGQAQVYPREISDQGFFPDMIFPINRNERLWKGKWSKT